MDPHHQSKARLIAAWTMPTAVQAVVYVMVVALTVFLSSQDFIDKILFATGDFNPIRSGIGSVDFLLTRLIGEKLSGSLSLAVFWGAVGLIVNLLWWLGSNFSSELNNNLVYSKYVHPKDVNAQAQLQDFIKRTAIRTTVAVIGLVYGNYVISSGLPGIAERFSDITGNWDIAPNWGSLILTIALELLMLHMVVVLTRVVLLRKKVIND